MIESDNEQNNAGIEVPTDVSACVQDDASHSPVTTVPTIALSVDEDGGPSVVSSSNLPSVAPASSLPSPDSDTVIQELRAKAYSINWQYGNVVSSLEEATKYFENLVLLSSDEILRARTFLRHLSLRSKMAAMAVANAYQPRENLRLGEIPVEGLSQQVLEAETLASDVASQVMRVWVSLSEIAGHAPTARKCAARTYDISRYLGKSMITNAYHGFFIWEDENVSASCHSVPAVEAIRDDNCGEEQKIQSSAVIGEKQT